MQKNNNKCIRRIITILIFAIYGIITMPNIQVKASEGININYKTHIQSKGWESNYKTNGSTSGSVGEGKRLEAIRIKVTGDENLGVVYSTYIQKIGWDDYVRNGAFSGTSGKRLRLEAIKIYLTGSDASKYDIYYRVHAQKFGWLDWAKNNEVAGTTGYGYRLEAIEIKVLPKGSAAPGNVKFPYKSKKASVTYRTHVQSYGDGNYVSDGEVSGTTGEGKRLEAINIKVSDSRYSGGIVYKTHVQSIGWQNAVSNGQMSGTSGKSLRLEAIEISLTGELARQYDVYYRVHAQKFGWMGWAKNGEPAGTAGYSYRLEAIEIKLIAKDEKAPENTGNAYVDKNSTTDTENKDDLVYLKWNNKSKELNIYRKATEKKAWIRNVISHKVVNSDIKNSRKQSGNSLASCCDIWAIKGAFISTKSCDGEFSDIFKYPIIHNDAEWEMAIREVINNEMTPDFVGGSLHGNEVVNNVLFIVDGKTYNLSDVNKLNGLTCSTFEIKRNSDVYRDNTLEFNSTFNPEKDEPTSGDKIATHYVDYIFTHNDITISQDLNWLVDTKCNYSCMAMLGVKRVAGDGITQITDTGTREGDTVEYDCSKSGSSTGIYKSKANCKETHLWNKGTNGGLKCDFTAKILEETAMAGKNLKISNSQVYNKIYFGYCPNNKTVNAGDIWHCKARYTIDYKGVY